ncbi:MAG: mevalonate kinase [Bacteroidia bacterium]|nr:mevalonate kinase [Bacteroidia bacterium]NNJ55133.1 mevalonate kinase [Bacteroidia bacterium]
MKESQFYSKILLFGEYGIIQDSMGLSIPYNFYKGKLHYDADTYSESNEHLRTYFTYLSYLENQGTALAKLDLARFKQDLLNGIAFDSSIPQGFGVGSSGALVAAIYDKYAVDKIDPENISKEELPRLKSIFGQLESHFHGKSSGLDPLICYLNLPVIIKSKEDLDTVGLPQETTSSKGAIFLLNTQVPGETQPMVQLFMEKMKEKGFRNMVKTELKKYNDECITSFLKGDFSPLFTNLKHLSALLLQNFSPMIPDAFKEAWSNGIETGDYYLKLCGSGGGGYILGFTRDFEKAQIELKDYQLELVHKI